jgi:hypothetical protein
MDKENIVRTSTGVIALAGLFLAFADSVKNIPELAPYAHWGTVITAFAIAFKNFAIVVYETTTGKKWESPKA